MLIINMLLYCFVVVTIATIPSTNDKLTHLSACTKGRITHYTSYDEGGACGFGEVSTKVTEGYVFSAALSEAFYDGGNKCGICYEIVGADGAIRVMATDGCPASDDGTGVCSGDMLHFDLASNAKPYLFDSDKGNTNGNVTFRMVACDLDGNIKIKTRGTSSNYYFFVVMNHVIGLKSTFYSLDNGATYTELERPNYNTYAISLNESLPLPFQIKLISIADEELVIDVNYIESETTFDSGVQFTIPDDKFFDVETLEETAKPDDIDECCDQSDDVATVYTDYVHGVWIAQGTDSVNCTDNPYEGSYCVKAELSQWDGIQFFSVHAFDTDLYSNLTFYVKASLAGDDCLSVTASYSTERTHVHIDKANIWQYVNLPIETFGEGDVLQSFQFYNVLEERTFYFDEIKWIRSDVDSAICADKYISDGLNNGIGISIITILMIFITLIY
ncbi:Expansin-B5 [Entamoeba marina]